MKRKNLLLNLIIAICFLCAISYLITIIVSEFSLFFTYRSLITNEPDEVSVIMDNSYIAVSNVQLSMAITNLVMVLVIVSYFILHIINTIKEKNFKTFDLFSLGFFCVEIYLLQQFIINLISDVTLSQNTSSIYITAILCFIAFAILYFVILFKNKTNKNNEPPTQ